MSSQSRENLARISQPATRVMAVRVGGKKPPALDIDPRWARAFPEQAENTRRFNEAMEFWWRDVAVDLTRDP